jgi:hypothetical protein
MPSEPVARHSGTPLLSQAMQEAEIGWIAVSGQPSEKFCETPSQQKKNWTCTCHSIYNGKYKIGLIQVSLGKKSRPSL